MVLAVFSYILPLIQMVDGDDVIINVVSKPFRFASSLILFSSSSPYCLEEPLVQP